MPMTYTVPEVVQRAARAALQVHHNPEYKLEDVYGISVADALASGHVTIDVVQKMNRFFAANEKPFLDEQRNLRDVRTSSTIRSWELHGGAHGRAWSGTMTKKAVDDGLIEADPFVALFKLTPDGVYSQFSLGAWRYEYGLDPRKAAKFVEEYMRATGNPLDLTKAFGESAKAVGNAVYRRYHTPNPFQQLFRAMMVNDPEYRAAVREDLDYARTIIPAEDRLLTEALSKQTFTSMSAMQAAKIVWPSFLAYITLAVEAPQLLDGMNADSTKPPDITQKPKMFTAYHDAINTYVAYFHPQGARYVDPGEDEKASGLPQEMNDIIWRAYYGKTLYFNVIKKTLLKARYWLKKQKLSGPLFSVLFADWMKKNWEGILQRIPGDADVYEPFAEFAKLNPVPKSGVSLQQMPSPVDVDTGKEAKTHLELDNKDTENLTSIPISKTASAAWAFAKNTPIGVGTLFDMTAKVDSMVVLKGAFGDPDNLDPATTALVFNHVSADGAVKSDEPVTVYDTGLLGWLKDGSVPIVQAHHQLPGTKYSPPITPPEPAPAAEPPATVDDAVWAMLKDDFEGSWSEFTVMDLSDTITSDTMQDVYDIELKAGEILIDKVGNQLTFLKAFMTPEGPILVVKSPDGDMVWYEDADMAEVVSKGTVKFASLSGIPTPEPVWADDPKEPPTPTTDPWWKTTEAEYTPKWSVGSVVFFEGEQKRIVGIVGAKYVLQNMHTFLGNAGVPFPTFPMLAKSVDTYGKLVESTISTADAATLVTVKDGIHVDDPEGFSAGDSFEAMDSVVFYARTYAQDANYYLVWFPDALIVDGVYVGYDGFKLINADDLDTVESSYKPTELKPEPGAEDAMDMPDPEQGSMEMCGTQAAINFMQGKGWTPAVKSESKNFVLDLGGKYEYPKKKDVRVIIGYAFKSKQTVYIIMTDKGNINWKTTVKGNIDYQPFIETIQSVVDDLKPKPSDAEKAAESKYPKLNYHLSTEAKAVAQHKGIIFQPSPKDAAFSVGTKLVNKDTGDVYRMIGWSKDIAGISPDVFAILKPPGTLDIIQASTLMLPELFEVVHQHKSKLNTKTKEITFGKGASDVSYQMVVNGVSLPSALPEGWNDPDPVKQPPMKHMPSPGKHVSAGIVAVVPAGSSLIAPGSSSTLPTMEVALVYPTNEFGGYKLTYPKGTVDPGESIEHAAVREVWEETGLSVKPVAYLGDFKGNDSVTRFFIGYITGGDPKKAGKETDAVTFKPFGTGVDDFWMADLHERDKKVTEAAILWVGDNGMPADFVPEQAATHTAVTGPQDVEGQTGKIFYNPDFKFTPKKEADKQQIEGPIDYVVSGSTTRQAEGVANGSYAKHEYDWWKYEKQATFIAKEFPPVGGQSFPEVGVKIKVGDVPYTYEVKAYVHMVVGSYDEKVSVEEEYTDFLIAKNTTGTGWMTAPVQSNQPDIQSLVYTPDQFAPVDEAPQPKTKTLPGSTAKVDVWQALAHDGTFPVDQAWIDALKKGVSGYFDDDPTSIVLSKTGWVGGLPPYAATFEHSDYGTMYTCKGYAKVEDSVNALTEYFCVARNDILDTYEVFLANMGFAENTTVVPDEDVDTGAGNPPFFTHPDPAINALIQMIAGGSSLKSVGWTNKQFKAVCKKASFPYSQQIPKAMAQDVAKLFTPDQPVSLKDQIIGNLALKAKGKSTSKVAKQVVQTTAATMPDSPVVTKPKPKVGKLKTAKPVDDYNSAMIQKIIEKPEPKLFFPTKQTVSGGSNPSKVLTSAGGQAWFFKMSKDDNPARAYAEAAAYKFMQAVLHDDAVPVGAMEYEGKVGSIQPLLEGEAVQGSPGDLDDDDKARVLKQHMIDMFFGDHDGFPCNWMRLKDGRLVAIDRGQAFKHLVKGTKTSLDPYWDDPGNQNSGQVWGKQLLREWIEGKTQIPAKAWKAARGVIDAIASVPKTTLESMLVPLFDSMKMSDSERAARITKLTKQQASYLKDWTTAIKAYKSKFAWPTGTGVKIKTEAATDHDPKDMDFGAAEAKDIQKAAEAGTPGRMVRIDRDAIEGQEVMVRRVLWAKGADKIPSTLINFRVARHVGLTAGKKMLTEFIAKGGKIAKVTKTTTVAGSQGNAPGVLQIDDINGYWGKILAAIITLNHHLAPASMKTSGKEPDGAPNKDTLAACFGSLESLKKLKQQTAKDMQGKNSTTGEPNDAINAMASLYIDYIEDHIKPVADDIEGHMHTHTANVTPYVYKPKPTTPDETDGDEAVITTSSMYDIEVQNGGARIPTLTKTPQGLLVESLVGAPWSPESQPTATIRGKQGAAELIILLPSPIENLQAGYEGYKGLAWGIMEGEPSNATVSYLMRLFEGATGVKSRPATKKDRQVHYWVKQAYLLQGNGKVHPKPQGNAPDSGVGLSDPEFTAAVMAYRNGNDDGALASLKQYVSDKLGLPVSELEKMSKGKIDGVFSKDGTGFQYVERIGWDRAKLVKLLGANYRICHHLTKSPYSSSMYAFLEVLGDYPALIAQNQRRFNGAGNTGGSPLGDLKVGGTQGVFTCFRRGKTNQRCMLYFDTSLMLRSDVMAIPGTDSWGNVWKTRATTPEVWKNEADSNPKHSVDCGSDWQVNVRHAIDFRTYLWEAVCYSKSDMEACIKHCHDMGWTEFARGRKPEQVFTNSPGKVSSGW